MALNISKAAQFASVALLGFAVNGAAQSTNVLMMGSAPLCPYNRTFDGQWLGTTIASDGKCYFGSSTHENKHGAGFFRYDPASRIITQLAEDLTPLCGENLRFTPPQGKLHSDIVEFNGWLYFSTHLGNEWPEGRAAYTGGHVLGYEMATGNFRDFGVIRSNYTCYSAVGVDKVRNKLISFVTKYWDAQGSTDSPTDSHIYRLDLATGAKQDLGVVPGFNTFFFFVDARGDCWISCDSDNGALRVVRSATGLMERFDNVLPETVLGTRRWWDWAKALPDGNSCAFKLFNGNFLYVFNASVFQTNHAAAFVTIGNIGPAPSGAALGGNHFFYIQRANRQPGNQEFKDFHLMSIALQPNAPILDHGLIMDQSGRLVWRLPGLTADDSGNVYGVGDWWLLPGEQGTIWGTLRHEDVNASTNYFAFPRGEFFAVANLSSTLNAQSELALTTAGGGTVSASPAGALFPKNAVITLSATPASGWTFLGWSGDASGTSPTTTLVLTRDEAVQAVFGTSLNTSVLGAGSINRNPSAALYPFGSLVRLTALPQPGNFFSNWSNAASGSLSPLDYSITTVNSTVSATFNSLAPGRVSLAVTANGRGQVNTTPAGNSCALNQIVNLTAIPAPGQTFTGWGADAAGTSNPLPLAMNGSKSVTANFTSKPALGFRQFTSANQGLELLFSGDTGARYEIRATADFLNWSTLSTLTNFFGTATFTDPEAASLRYRFYQALLLP